MIRQTPGTTEADVSAKPGRVPAHFQQLRAAFSSGARPQGMQFVKTV
jgi:hypothetical protein